MNNIENGQSAAKQIFKSINGYEGLYEITNDGKVYSLYKNIFLKPQLTLDGYKMVRLFKNGKAHTKRICRLVAQAFIDNPNNFPQVNHKDFNTQNDVVDNLEWCNNKYNSHYSIDNHRTGFGNQYYIRNKQSGRFEINKRYTFYNKFTNEKYVFNGQKECSEFFNCKIKSLRAILGGYVNTGCYVKRGKLAGFKIDSENLEVHRPTAIHGVEGSPSK
jgi:hypothetical protein